MTFHAVFVGGAADGEHRVLRERLDHHAYPVFRKVKLSDWASSAFGFDDVDTVQVEHYTLRHFRCTSRHGGHEKFYFYAQAEMSDAKAFRRMLMGYAGGVKGEETP